jgi:hypothetical protein
VLGHEVAGEQIPESVVLLGREDPGKRGDVGGGREIETAEAGPATQHLEVDRTGTGIPGGDVDPALGLLGPLVQVHASEGVLRAGQGAFSALRARSSALTERPKLGLVLRQTSGSVQSSSSSAAAMKANQLSACRTPSSSLIA